MPILDLQRRLREIGRIRIGEQVEGANGRKRPAKLTKFRLTSKDRQVLEAAAELWGGTVEPWENDGPQFELYTDTNQMPVVIPPTEMAFSQFYEQWSAGGCQVRCDGVRDMQSDHPCHCDPEARACKITTRLSVMLPDLPGLGVWRVETHGYYAAVELNGAVEVCQQFAGHGRMLPARLRLEPRSVIRPGRDGKAQTQRFAVPVLDVDVRVGQLAALASGAAGHLGSPVAGEFAAPGPVFQPVPELAPPSLAEQLDAIDQDVTPHTRPGGKAPLPATGIAPRPAAEAPPPQPTTAPQSAPGGLECARCGGTLAGYAVAFQDGAKVHKDGCPEPGAPTPAPVEELPLTDPRDDHARQVRRFHAIAAQRWPDETTEMREEYRHLWMAEHGVASLNDIDAQEVGRLADVLDAEVRAAAPPVPDYQRPHDWSEAAWRTLLAEHGVKITAALRVAKQMAEEDSEQPPSSLAKLAGRERLARRLAEWVREQRP